VVCNALTGNSASNEKLQGRKPVGNPKHGSEDTLKVVLSAPDLNFLNVTS
jgi:hypothetical protein